MRVAEGVDLQGADVAGQQEKVLAGRGEHVPRVEVQERHGKVQTNGRGHGDNEVRKHVVTQCERDAAVLVCELPDDDVDDGEGRVHHDDAVDDHTAQIEPPGALRTITKRQDELDSNEQDTRVPQDDEDDVANAVTERIDSWVCQPAGDEVESQIEVCERKVREEQLDKLVDKFNVQEDLASKSVIRLQNLSELDQGVDGSEEGTVQPSSSLGDELGNGIWIDIMLVRFPLYTRKVKQKR